MKFGNPVMRIAENSALTVTVGVTMIMNGRDHVITNANDHVTMNVTEAESAIGVVTRVEKEIGVAIGADVETEMSGIIQRGLLRQD